MVGLYFWNAQCLEYDVQDNIKSLNALHCDTKRRKTFWSPTNHDCFNLNKVNETTAVSRVIQIDRRYTQWAHAAHTCGWSLSLHIVFAKYSNDIESYSNYNKSVHIENIPSRCWFLYCFCPLCRVVVSLRISCNPHAHCLYVIWASCILWYDLLRIEIEEDAFTINVTVVLCGTLSFVFDL